MARRRGQVDERKSEAILDAAATLFADKGLQAKMRDEYGEEVPALPQLTAPKVTSRHISPAPRRSGPSSSTTAIESLHEGGGRPADLT